MVDLATGIRILLVGLSPELFSSLKHVAHKLNNLRWIAQVDTPEKALEVSKSRTPNVLLLPLPLETPHHYDVIREVLGLSVHPHIVIISQTLDDDSLFQALSVGAEALVSFDTPPEFIVSTMQKVCQGEQPIEYHLISRMGLVRQALRNMREPSMPYYASVAPCPLSPRDLSLLSLIAKGCSNKEVAVQLGLRQQTVKNRTSSILKKLRANHRVHAVMLALRNRWITLS